MSCVFPLATYQYSIVPAPCGRLPFIVFCGFVNFSCYYIIFFSIYESCAYIHTNILFLESVYFCPFIRTVFFYFSIQALFASFIFFACYDIAFFNFNF